VVAKWLRPPSFDLLGSFRYDAGVDGLVCARERYVIKPKRGSRLLEWVIVTLLLTLATYAVLQVIGPDVEVWIERAAEWLRQFWGAT
jgi:hypothetical protein